ncbi:Aim18p [Saccharomyces cerevisiae YJM554]|nr:Aim18p [Saccharomyces cerevisiae YJM554]
MDRGRCANMLKSLQRTLAKCQKSPSTNHWQCFKRNFTSIRATKYPGRSNSTFHYWPWFAASTLLATSLYYCDRPVQNDDKTDAFPSHTESIQVDSSVSDFPLTITALNFPVSTTFKLLGYGQRHVTFLRFKVYALGLYLAENDENLVSDTLNETYLHKYFLDVDDSKTPKENLARLLKRDDSKSVMMIDDLLDSGMRMLAKITPVRNTDFKHLKEGLVKTISKHPDVANNKDTLAKGLSELNDAFSRKGSVRKNDDLIIELLANGALQFSYHDSKNNEFEVMGVVNNQLVGKFLFSQYLCGEKSPSPQAKKTAIDKLVTLL